MKIFTLLLSLSLFLGAFEIDYKEDYATALRVAKQTDKKLFVFITTPKCKYCDKLKKTTFKDKKIYTRINKEYISVQVTKNKHIYPKKLKADGTPMIYFLDNKENVIDYSLGYWDSVDFNFMLDDVQRKYKKMRR